MTLTELVTKTMDIAGRYRLVKTVTEGDVYDNFAGHTIKYGAFDVDIESVVRSSNAMQVGLVIYYADRLLQDKSNALPIKDDAINVLQSVLFQLDKEKEVLSLGDYTFTPFEQRFDDYLAGAYARVTITVKSSVTRCGMEVETTDPEIDGNVLCLKAVGEGLSTIAMNNYNGNEDYITVEYSLDNSKTWTTWDYSPITLTQGAFVLFRGTGTGNVFSRGSMYSIFVFGEDDLIEASGSVMGLIDKGAGTATRTGKNDGEGFVNLFRGCTGLLTAPKLPATTLCGATYAGMFENCTKLTKAPELPATTVPFEAYEYMFYGCSSLTYVKMLGETFGMDATTSWLAGVASAGTIVLSNNRTSNPEIPSGWTIEEV